MPTLIDRLANAERYTRMTDDGKPEVLVTVRGADLREALDLLGECGRALGNRGEDGTLTNTEYALLSKLRAAGVKG